MCGQEGVFMDSVHSQVISPYRDPLVPVVTLAPLAPPGPPVSSPREYVGVFHWVPQCPELGGAHSRCSGHAGGGGRCLES